jgi:hypothetical protein
MRNELWSILCPGPSLGFDFLHDPYDQLIAVNGAVTMGCVDYWAICDVEVFSVCMHESPWILGYPTILWIPERWYCDISNMSILRSYFERFKREVFNSADNGVFAASMPLGRDIPWRERTMFMAIALAVLKGARVISIYGADLKGEGYFSAGLTNLRTRHTAKRWEEERYWLSRIMRECKRHGIRVRRR